MATSSEPTSNVEANSSLPWQKLLDRHLKILSEHLSLWSSIKDGKLPGTRDHGAAQTCLDNTQVMIQNFQNLQMTFDKTSSEPTNVQHTVVNALDAESESRSRPRKQQHTAHDPLPPTIVDDKKPVKDFSDLFTIDTNPTPIEQLQSSKAGKRAEKNLKRKLSQSKLHPIGLPEPLQETDQPTKRSKQDSAPGTIHTDNKQQTASGREDHDEDNDSFVAKVQQKHQEKESRRQKKLDKKRKRESNTSLDDFAAARPKKPVKKKPKKDSSATTAQISESNTVGRKRAAADSNTQTTSNSAQSKKRKKS